MKPRIIREGKIIYEQTVHPQTSKHFTEEDRLFSMETQLEIARANIPEEKIVYFRSGQSRTEMLDNDYGYRSPAITFRNYKATSYLYCKSLQFVDFCEEITPPAVLTDDKAFIPQVQEMDETKNILGYLCRRAKITEENQSYYVFYSDAITIDDPTGAVLHSPLISGFILELEEIPGTFGADYFKRLRVNAIQEQSLEDSIFLADQTYRKIESIDRARQENLKQLNRQSENEWLENALTIQEQKQFEGYWLSSRNQDLVLVEIRNIRAGSSWNNEFAFTTYYLTAKGSFKKKIKEKAAMKGRKLFVEEKPNYRLYALDEKKQTIIQENFPFFNYSVVTEVQARQLIEQYHLD